MTDHDDDNLPWEEEDGMAQYESQAQKAESESLERANAQPETNLLDTIYSENDLIKRARKMAVAQLIDWPHMKRVGDGISVPNPRSDANRMTFLAALFNDCTGRCPHPYFDTFSGLAVDHEGVEINERNSHAVEIGKAMDAVGLSMQSYTQIDDSFKRFALGIRRNSLLDHFNENCTDWDGVSRLDDYLINLFRLRDNPLNRDVSRYFWFSLYNRINDPGCQAPLSIALIGAQDVGKSFFSVMLCRTIMGNPKAVPTALNLSDIERKLNDWLRRMTGKSIIANIGELRGYKKTDIETFKEFTARTGDSFDHKWGSTIETPRQWVIVADANSYEGFNRDETGNRRFYPLFVNQCEDKDGQPHWPDNTEDPWKADFSTFEQDVWQLMAEVRHEMQKGGPSVYQDLVSIVSRAVAAFSKDELMAGRGIIKDENMDMAVRELITGVDIHLVDGNKYQGFFIHSTEIMNAWNKTQRGTINNASMLRIMRINGWEKANIHGHGRGWFLRRMSDSQSIHAIRYAAWVGAVRWKPEFEETAQSHKLFNAALKRVMKRVNPDRDDF